MEVAGAAWALSPSSSVELPDRASAHGAALKPRAIRLSLLGPHATSPESVDAIESRSWLPQKPRWLIARVVNSRRCCDNSQAAPAVRALPHPGGCKQADAADSRFRFLFPFPSIRCSPEGSPLRRRRFHRRLSVIARSYNRCGGDVTEACCEQRGESAPYDANIATETRSPSHGAAPSTRVITQMVRYGPRVQQAARRPTSRDLGRHADHSIRPATKPAQTTIAPRIGGSYFRPSAVMLFEPRPSTGPISTKSTWSSRW